LRRSLLSSHPGEITENLDTFGTYYLYQPTTLAYPPQTLVVIHGTPPPSESVSGNGGWEPVREVLDRDPSAVEELDFNLTQTQIFLILKR